MSIKSSSPLLDLPNELLAHITSHLTRRDLLTLRLVSIAINERTSSRMAHACFSVVPAALWLPRSLSHACSLLRHKQARTWVKCIRFHVDRPVLAEGQAARHCAEGCPEDVPIREQYVAILDSLKGVLEPGGEIAGLLDELFALYAANCAEREWRPDIWITDQETEIAHDGEENSVRPLEFLERLHGGLVSYAPKDDCATEVALVLNRMEAAGLAPGTLVIGSTRMGVPVRMFGTPGSVFRATSPVFADGMTLYLSLQAYVSETEMRTHETDIAHAADFWRAVGPRIRTLYWVTARADLDLDEQSLIGPAYSNDMILDRLCDDGVAIFPALRSLTFRFLVFDRERLVDFLGRHRDTLRRISIVHGFFKEGVRDPEVRREAVGWSEEWREGIQDALVARGLPRLESTEKLHWWHVE